MSDRNAVIKKAYMSEEMQQDAVNCATQAMEKYNIETDIAAFIKQKFDKKYNPIWHCIVGRRFGSYVTYETKHFIYFYLGKIAILLFKKAQTNEALPQCNVSFPMLVINAGMPSFQRHRDKKDPALGWCAIVPLGDFTDGDFGLPNLNLRLNVRARDILFLRPYALEHFVYPCKGSWYSLVFVMHQAIIDSATGN
ncbi:hypothetical protein PhCBS80983_g06320 [Powellomyces hirtus]|uniref:Dynein light chain n=1 Tax=Powellomyces hirtus TaxID=109895 RepID=A0A507DNY9_9FUNG|nr:hypothetical protein PhCBS80983_g06320 [Powellomyces hirtus]